MNIVNRFAGQSRSDQRLLLAALPAIITIRVALWLMPFATLQRFILNTGAKSRRPLGDRIERPAAQPFESAEHAVESGVERIAWAVSAVSRYVPRASCLTQALAAQFLLGRAGYPSQIQLGVRNDRQAGFEAHAWLVFENRVVIGGQDLDRYATLPTWEARL